MLGVHIQKKSQTDILLSIGLPTPHDVNVALNINTLHAVHATKVARVNCGKVFASQGVCFCVRFG